MKGWNYGGGEGVEGSFGLDPTSEGFLVKEVVKMFEEMVVVRREIWGVSRTKRTSLARLIEHV